MAQNKEQLDKLLQFIKRLIDEPGNEDFVSKLQRLVGVSSPKLHFDNTKVDEIEKYLGLDYRLDSTSPIIDYSFIDDEFIRSQLVSDYREMLRYRFGVRSHKIDFSEFCRYAILQVEQLLNFFYNRYFSSANEIMKYINSNVSWTKVDSVDSVSTLPLSVKLSAISRELRKKCRESLDFAREVRNAQSHRGKDTLVNDINTFKNKLNDLGFPLTKEGEVFWNGIKDDRYLVEKFNAIPKADLWKYRFQLWYNREPFDEIIISIEELTKYIKDSIIILKK